MFSFFNRKFLHTKWSACSSSTCFLHIRNSYLRFCSIATQQTVDYLVNKCGLTQESALKAAQRINIKSTTNPDSVLALLDSYGFPSSCILKIISNDPRILRMNPKKLLEPKIVYFSTMGISGPDLARILSKDSSLLVCASLRNQIIPSIGFLVSLLHDRTKIVQVLNRLRWTIGFRKIMESNVEILRNQGVPDFSISKLIILCSRVLTSDQSRFNEVVLQAIEMGSDPSSLTFIYAVRSLTQMNKTTLDAKLEVFKSFGWSDDKIHCLFRKNPYCLARSEKILKMQLDFFMNKLGWTVVDVLRIPPVLNFSLEKRNIPRCSVIQVLLSRGLMKKKSMSSALLTNEASFLEKFVMKYQQELPQLLKEYKTQT